MRILPLLIIGASALILSACDDAKPRRVVPPKAAAVAEASADCCCKDICPKSPEGSGAPVVGTLEQEGGASSRSGGQVQRVAHERRGGYRHRVRTGTEGVGYLDEDLAGDADGYRRSYRSGAEGVGYLDDDRGGYRRVGTSVSVEERETYEESRRSSESGYHYTTGGGYEAYGSESRDGYGGGQRRGGRRGGGYAGVDRDGYLTWPGKTE